MKVKREKELMPISKGFWHNIKTHKYAYILMIPALVSALVFQYFPMFGIVLAFKDFNIFDGIWGSPWVGFDNFVLVFSQREMLSAIGNTLVMSLIFMFGGTPFSIILALLINEIWNMKFKKVVQTISYMPHFLSWVSVVGLVYVFVAIEGPLNSMLSFLLGPSYEPKNFLMHSEYFLTIAFLTNLWKQLGWSTIIYLAAIAGIDPSLYEAATIDGAGKLRQIWHITLPGIRQTIIIIFVMAMGGLFASNFELVYGLQNVYTIDDTEVIGTLIYRTGLQRGNYSAATAFGLSQGVITITLILLANFVSKKIAQVSIW